MRIAGYTDMTVQVREYGKTRAAPRFVAVVNDGRGTANVADRVSGLVVYCAVGVHTEREAVGQFLAEREPVS